MRDADRRAELATVRARLEVIERAIAAAGEDDDRRKLHRTRGRLRAQIRRLSPPADETPTAAVEPVEASDDTDDQAPVAPSAAADGGEEQ